MNLQQHLILSNGCRFYTEKLLHHLSKFHLVAVFISHHVRRSWGINSVIFYSVKINVHFVDVLIGGFRRIRTRVLCAFVRLRFRVARTNLTDSYYLDNFHLFQLYICKDFIVIINKNM